MSRAVEYHRKPTPSNIREAIQAYRRQQSDVTSFPTLSIGSAYGLCSSSSRPLQGKCSSPALSSSSSAAAAVADRCADSSQQQQQELEQQKWVKQQEAQLVSQELDICREIESIKQELAALKSDMGEAEFEQRLRDKEQKVAELKQQLEATQLQQEMAAEVFNARHKAAQEELRRHEEARKRVIQRNGELDVEMCEVQKEIEEHQKALGKQSFETFRMTFFAFVALQKEHQQLLSKCNDTPLPN